MGHETNRLKTTTKVLTQFSTNGPIRGITVDHKRAVKFRRLRRLSTGEKIKAAFRASNVSDCTKDQVQTVDYRNKAVSGAAILA